MTKISLDVVIPSTDGKELLKKHLPGIIKYTPHLQKIILVDNASKDGTAEFLKTHYPQVIHLYQPQNLFFTKAVNIGFRAATADLIVLLNNDVEVRPRYLDRVLIYFQDPNVFAVTFNEINSSWPEVSWRQGKFYYERGVDKTKPRYSAWASGGSAVFNRRLWEKLGGFDEIYSPGYWEDIDLGWRAWKTGYKIIWEPKSEVEHQHESSFRKLDQNYVALIKERNELLFTWKNISDRSLLKSHIQFLVKYSINHPGYLKVILSALKEKSKLVHFQAKLSDREVLALINQIV